MKKITAILGRCYSEFDHQVKNILNDMSDKINKIYLHQKLEELKYSLCDLCNKEAHIITLNLNDDTHKSFCNKCLSIK